MNGFEVTHPLKATDHTVLLVYGMSMDMKIFTFRLPGLCVILTISTAIFGLIYLLEKERT